MKKIERITMENIMSVLNIKIDHTLKGSKWQVHKNFLSDLVKGMCEGTTLYFDKYNHIDKWHPLTYSERCMYALLSTSAAKISPVIMPEIPLARHVKKTNGYAKDGVSGRLDLWIHLNEKFDVVLELKRVAVGLRNVDEKEPSKKFRSAWREVITQADALTKQTKDWNEEVIRVGLLVVYGYVSSKITQKIPSDDKCEEFREKLMSHIGKLNPEPDWCSYWIPPENMRNLDNEINPIIAIIAYIVK
jgi:hypothetical protein